jgi:hypothetical protein
MKGIEKLKPGDYLMPDGRTNHVLEVQDLKINVSQILKEKLNLRIQELTKKEKVNG